MFLRGEYQTCANGISLFPPQQLTIINIPFQVKDLGQETRCHYEEIFAKTTKKLANCPLIFNYRLWVRHKKSAPKSYNRCALRIKFLPIGLLSPC